MEKRSYYNRRRLQPPIVDYYFKQIGTNVSRVLDLGCGLGCIGRLKPNNKIEVYGVDIDKYAVEEAKKYEQAEIIDLEKGILPFKDEFFDGIIARDILEHLLKPWEIVNEMHRVLKQFGIVIASVAMAKPSVVWNDYTHIRGFSKKAVENIFLDAGFKIEHVRKMGGVPLMGRLKAVHLIPKILKIPLVGSHFAQSWEIKAIK